MKLKCVLRYRNDARGLVYEPGDVERDPRLVQFLRSDAPGAFEVVEEKSKSVRKPARNKAVQEPPVDK